MLGGARPPRWTHLRISIDKYSNQSTLRSMASGSRSNPLALAVLSCLHERPMHPYEVAQTLRQRGKHQSIRLHYGSLYNRVDGLEKPRAVRPLDTIQHC